LENQINTLHLLMKPPAGLIKLMGDVKRVNLGGPEGVARQGWPKVSTKVIGIWKGRPLNTARASTPVINGHIVETKTAILKEFALITFGFLLV